MSNQNPNPNELPQLELSPEATCTNSLMHLAEVQPSMEAKAMSGAGEYFTASTGLPAPEDLTTRLVVYPKNTPEDPMTQVTVQFHSDQATPDQTNMQSLEITETDQGIELSRIVRPINFDEAPKRVRLTDAELKALSADAISIRSQIVAKQLARLKLGELVDLAIDDEGRRNFHVGDLTSVITGWSPRGEEGMSDLLTFMTGERPQSSQLGRFIMEVTPSLVAQVPELEDFMPRLQQANQLTTPELYKLVDEVRSTIGDFKKVRPLDPSEHTVMDPIDEMELDSGMPSSKMTDDTDKNP